VHEIRLDVVRRRLRGAWAVRAPRAEPQHGRRPAEPGAMTRTGDGRRQRRALALPVGVAVKIGDAGRRERGGEVVGHERPSVVDEASLGKVAGRWLRGANSSPTAGDTGVSCDARGREGSLQLGTLGSMGCVKRLRTSRLAGVRRAGANRRAAGRKSVAEAGDEVIERGWHDLPPSAAAAHATAHAGAGHGRGDGVPARYPDEGDCSMCRAIGGSR
jgi:hypothetical protein